MYGIIKNKKGHQGARRYKRKTAGKRYKKGMTTGRLREG
jgi:hypothetical protein